MSEPEPDLEQILADNRRVVTALRIGVREALIRHRRAGNPVVIWRDGKLTWLAPEQIPTPPET